MSKSRLQVGLLFVASALSGCVTTTLTRTGDGTVTIVSEAPSWFSSGETVRKEFLETLQIACEPKPQGVGHNPKDAGDSTSTFEALPNGTNETADSSASQTLNYKRKLDMAEEIVDWFPNHVICRESVWRL